MSLLLNVDKKQVKVYNSCMHKYCTMGDNQLKVCIKLSANSVIQIFILQEKNNNKKTYYPWHAAR